MDFLTNTNNLLLLATLITSGLALALPQIMGHLNKQLLSVHESVQWINQRQAQILDIRTPDEYKAGHIANSKHLPLAKLKKAGCKDVVCMEGGISAWNQAGMPLIK